MTPKEIRLVQDSFARVEPISDAAAALFYDILLSRNPELRPLFHATDLKAQGTKLMAILRTVVVTLDQPEVFLPAVRGLGQRHGNYGAKDHHYAMVGAALIETLSRGLGPDFDEDTAAAWGAAYRMLAETMSAAARTGDATLPTADLRRRAG